MYLWQLVWNLVKNLSGGNVDISNTLSEASDWFSGGIGDFLNNLTGASAANSFSAQEAAKAREHATAERIASQDYNSREAQISRDWQMMYDSTAMQRRVADIKAAGLNPMLLYGNGANASLGTSGGSSAATSSSGSSASASASGNASSALSGIIRAVATVVKAAK